MDPLSCKDLTALFRTAALWLYTVSLYSSEVSIHEIHIKPINMLIYYILCALLSVVTEIKCCRGPSSH